MARSKLKLPSAEGGAPAQAAEPEPPAEPGGVEREARALDLPIATVTLLEDRAQIVRRGGVTLAATSERVRVERVAPVAADKTLAVTVIEGSAHIIDARIRRRAVIRLRGDAEGTPSDLGAEREALERERDELRHTLVGVRVDRELNGQEEAALDRASALALAELGEDVAWGTAVEASWSERLDQIAHAQRGLGKRQIELDREIQRLEAILTRLGERLDALDGPAEEERADLEIDVQGAAGTACVLRIEYAVPGACWRPCHTAQLIAAQAGRGAQVEIDTDAAVWQNTGEDWRDVELVFSTERASLGTEPPRLASDVLAAQKRGEQIVVEAREQEIDTAGLGQGAAASAARAMAVELPGIDDAGQVQTWRAAERATVPSDGRPYRVRLASFRSDAEVELVAFPELMPVALLKSTQENRGGGPLLAGPVDLVRDSGLCGRPAIRYVAPGERFELGWGPDADLRLTREVEVLDEKARMLSSWAVRRTLVRIKLSNLGGESKRLSVTERLPVSEVEKVRISVDPERVTGRRRPDENGFLRWPVALEPFGHDELELVWELRRHEDVVGV